jgi:hypothetical protein
VLHQQPEGQSQMQHKGRQNNKYNKITIDNNNNNNKYHGNPQLSAR